VTHPSSIHIHIIYNAPLRLFDPQQHPSMTHHSHTQPSYMFNNAHHGEPANDQGHPVIPLGTF
jgi:hypothetical protein